MAGGAEAYKWVQRVARILKNEEGLPTKKVRRRLVQLLGRMRRAATTTGEPSVRAGLKQFLKVTRSCWPGLFRCYDTADLPRTNNDLEHTFGSHRYHERRSSGRRRASPGLVVMGSAGDLGLGDAAPAGGRLGVASGLCGGLARAGAKLERGARRGGSPAFFTLQRQPSDWGGLLGLDSGPPHCGVHFSTQDSPTALQVWFESILDRRTCIGSWFRVSRTQDR